MPADDPKHAQDKNAVDLTDPARTEELSDEELKKVTGGFQRATLAGPSLPTSQLNVGSDTLYGGLTLNTAFGGLAHTVYGGISGLPIDKLKR
ncbi:MAG: bacteriocin [Alphaproteobacteria bacterium]